MEGSVLPVPKFIPYDIIDQNRWNLESQWHSNVRGGQSASNGHPYVLSKELGLWMDQENLPP